ncbi:diaminopimelate epimerase [Sciscionella sediminilitoris]|uniref:diaminopimelate epimerase n=1 Tax=Sciscionella sediminilitoris TaxID=1445613 RepID=UPI0009E8011D|nr:diaminopimelate epimerase [Sciscionella sp. SE31]
MSELNVRFCKGHGTENDFVVLPDPAGELALTPSLVRALCDRRAGIGADGVLRVVRCAAAEDAPSGVDGWFMDYRNADGSLAEMCGNGARVFARYLVENGWQQRGAFTVHTRAGARPVEVHQDGSVTVAMGPARVHDESAATVHGVKYPGSAVDVGNPHLVCLTEVPVADIDLWAAPEFDGVLFPNGVNVEFVNRLAPDRLRMRVYERGSGETRSCGTGTVASAAAALHAESVATGTVTVEVPGGRVTVGITEDGSSLTGPAVLVGSGVLDPQWWAAH